MVWKLTDNDILSCGFVFVSPDKIDILFRQCINTRGSRHKTGNELSEISRKSHEMVNLFAVRRERQLALSLWFG
jgi:hypothetical protein